LCDFIVGLAMRRTTRAVAMGYLKAVGNVGWALHNPDYDTPDGHGEYQSPENDDHSNHDEVNQLNAP
jgi:hypothetical protein